MRERGSSDMIKWVDPIIARFRLLPRPQMFKVPARQGESGEPTPFGQLLAERVAAVVGSWPFLIIQAFFLILWLIYNTVQFTTHFDQPPYILLNLLLSFQAAFTGPVLLIAANVGALRDHRQYDRIEHLTAKTEDIGERTGGLADRLVEVERQLDVHISQSLRAHTEELRELCDLVRALHAAVVPGDGQAATLAKTDAAEPAPVVNENAATLADAAPDTTPSPTLATTPAASAAPRRPSPRTNKRR